jgi:hypothetical protein
MWTKRRFASWEVEGQVQERIDKALGEAERWRVGNTARGSRRKHLLEPILTRLGESLAWLPARAETVWLSLRSHPSQGQGHSESSPVEQGSS